MNELCYLSAHEALERFASRELSPVELMEAVIARADETEPEVNALCIRRFEEALDCARRAEQRYLVGRPSPRPLEGLPIAVKEETAIAGQRTTQGSLIYEHFVPAESAVVVSRVLAAGAIVHARSTAPEFSCAPFTHSRLWGVTRNPWNTAYSPGGSSGGSAAALAAGSTTLATGSDIAGSIRIPSSSCGVVGFKPPYGRVPESPPFNLDHYCHEGPLARTVADCALLENVMAGPHPGDITSLRPKLRIPRQLGSIEGWRIAVSVTLGDNEVDEDVARNTLAAARVFEDAGAIVEPVELPWRREELIRAMRIHLGVIFGTLIQREVEQHREIMTAYALRFAEDSRGFTPADYVESLEIEARVFAGLASVFRGFRVLICPTLAVPAFEAGDDYLDHGPTINGRPQPSWYEGLMTYPFNICSRCPVMSVPSGFPRSNVPTGLQIVGRPYDDVSVFRAAAAFESGAQTWLDTPGRRPALANR